jgi:hypothetical protein
VGQSQFSSKEVGGELGRCVPWFIINTLKIFMLLLDPIFVDCLPKKLKILSNLPASKPASKMGI